MNDHVRYNDPASCSIARNAVSTPINFTLFLFLSLVLFRPCDAFFLLESFREKAADDDSGV